MNERLARHFLRRLLREAEALAIEDAVEADVLSQGSIVSHGRMLTVFRRGPAAPDPISIRRVTDMLSRRRRRLPGESIQRGFNVLDLPVEEEEPQADETLGAPSDEAASRPPDRVRTMDLVRAVRAAAEPPRASDVATLLLLAQSLPNDNDAHRNALQALRPRQPIVTILCEAKGFEEVFLGLLKRGMVLPGTVSRCNGYEHSRSSQFQFDRMLNARWRVVSFAGFERDGDMSEDRIGDAARSVFPILAVAEAIEGLPSKLVQPRSVYKVLIDLNALPDDWNEELTLMMERNLIEDLVKDGRLGALDSSIERHRH